MPDRRQLRWVLTSFVTLFAVVVLSASHSSDGLSPHTRNAESLRQVALANLSIGKTRVAADLLEKSARLDPSSATIAVDLAVAQMANGRVADAAEGFANILEREAGNVTAAFNWALALERLANRAGAVVAWQQYLDLDPSGERAGEARSHLDHLRQVRTTWEEARQLLRPGVDRETVRRVVTEFPQRVRKRSQNVLLPAWAESGRAEELAVIRMIAEERASRDPYLLDIVLSAEKNGPALAAGCRAFAAGFDADNHHDTANGLLRYDEAASLLGRGGSPLAIGAAIYAASMAERAGENEEALRRLVDVERRLAESRGRYPAMAAESAWVRAIAFMQLGELQRSLDDFRTAHKLALRAGETENAAFIAAMIATNMELLIDPAEAVDLRIEALRGMDEVRADVRQMFAAYFETGYMALRNGKPHVGLAFLESAAAMARGAALPAEVASSTTQRAYALWNTGRGERAQIALDAARHEAAQLADVPTRDRTLSEIDYINGLIELKRRPDRAIGAFQSAIAINQRYGWHVQAAAAYAGCGEAGLAVGNRPDAERAFRAAITEMEHQRKGIDEPAMRIAYFERADLVFERLIDLLLDYERIDDALTVVEQKRARVLLDQVSGSRATKPLDTAAIVSALGMGQALLELTLLDRHAEAWLIHDGAVRHGQSTASGAEIGQAVLRHLAAIDAGDEATARREGRWLFEQLVAPVARDLPRDADLVIAADGILQRIPFATLVADDARYLIEHHALSATPSASVFLRNVGERKVGDSLLAVAESAPQGLDPLPNVAKEIGAIARLYPRGRVLVGRETTPEGFLAAARDVSLVHFAGHARTDLRQPSRSALLFESNGEVATPLTAEAISRSQLEGHPLVVLAACGTGRGRLHRNEGIDSLAAAFLQGGARGVLATLWDVDDAVSADLFRGFHRSLRNGARAADALRNAQLSMIHGTDSRERLASAWGSTVVIGTF
jgi:CHAT domain-containing protein/Tfp pilus assembly protein PilF